MPPNDKLKTNRYLFSPTYIEQIFYFWYSNRQLGAQWTNARIPADEQGQKANYSTVQRWIEDYGWLERAEALDVEAARKMDNLIIDERISMFKEHAEIGKQIREMGLKFLEEKGLEKDASALRAIADGIQIERSSRGLADALSRIASMDDATLAREISKLLPQAIDAEYEDVTVDENSE